ncbi:MAG: CRISPR-associated protein Cas4 [Methanobacteriota archaeon]|nr:MAG: CRISPR-associated protein Cas4 [Euryarchaeota archaeon]
MLLQTPPLLELHNLKTYAHCPYQLYLEKNLENKPLKDITTLKWKIINSARQKLEEEQRSQLQTLPHNPNLEEIQKALLAPAADALYHAFAEHKTLLPKDKKLLQKLWREAQTALKHETLLKAAKLKTASEYTGKHVSTLYKIVEPHAITKNYVIKNHHLGVVGEIDRIEKINGEYVPVKVKNGRPPVTGVWEGDQLQAATLAMLLEEKLQTKLSLALVEYTQIQEKRPVIITDELRKKVVRAIENIREILADSYVPPKYSPEYRCFNCKYKNVCHPDA